jgi:hypothetical protein
MPPSPRALPTPYSNNGVSGKTWVIQFVNFIIGVAGQNAANARALAISKIDRSSFLAGVAAQWALLDSARHPSVLRAAAKLQGHDDRAQFMAGVDIILAGIEALSRDRSDG